MAEFKVSRAQNRRGRQRNLPQPLRPGELGFCHDTGRIFVGGVESKTKAGVQVYPGRYTEAQNILDFQLIAVDVSGVSGFVIDDFKAYMADQSNLVTATAEPALSGVSIVIPDNQIYYDTDSGTVLVALTADQASGGTGRTAYISDIENYPDNNLTGLASPYIKTVNANGQFFTSSHGVANIVASGMNSVTSIGIAYTRLNVEILTEDSLDTNPAVEYILPPSASYTDFPTAFQYLMTEENVINADYSCYLDVASGAAEQFTASGTLKIVSSINQSNANLSDERVDIRQPTSLADDISFKAVFVSPSTVKIQYKHDFSADVIFKVLAKEWLSF